MHKRGEAALYCLCISDLINAILMLDCKDPLRSDTWVPCWVEENRSPVFTTESDVTPGPTWRQQLQPQAWTQSHL